MKPVRPERLERALAKAAGLHAPSAASRPDASDRLRIAQRGQAQQLALSEVLYLRAEAKRITVVTARGSFTLDGALVDLESRHAAQLIRVHRHTLVLHEAITAIHRVDDDDGGKTAWYVALRGTRERVPVARRLVPDVRARLLARQR